MFKLIISHIDGHSQSKTSMITYILLVPGTVRVYVLVGRKKIHTEDSVKESCGELSVDTTSLLSDRGETLSGGNQAESDNSRGPHCEYSECKNMS